MKKIHKLIIFVLLAFFIATGCSTGGDKLEVFSLGWYLENLHYSCWHNGSSDDTTAFLTLYINYEYSGGLLTSSDIDMVYVQSGSWRWEIPVKDEDIDTEKQHIRLSRLCLTRKHIIPIGKYTVEVVLANGSSSSSSLIVPAPGSTTTNGYSMLYTEDYGGDFLSSYGLLLKRAESVSQNKYATSLSISFRINDSRVYNGWVQFYGATGSYIGRTKNFRNFTTGVVASFINSGSGINTNNTTNTLSLSSSGDMEFVSGASFDDVYSYIIFLTDGEQYVGTSSMDVISSSAKTSF